MNKKAFVILILAAAAWACAQKETAAPAPASSAAKPATAEASQPESGPSGEILGAYEKIREQLASDQASGIATNAEALKVAAGSLAQTGPEPARVHLASLSTAAADLAKQTDLEKARAKFGEVSRHLVGALAAEPSLASERKIFECPMTKTYKKWVQPGDEVSNPYMGQKMATCGEPSKWSV